MVAFADNCISPIRRGRRRLETRQPPCSAIPDGNPPSMGWQPPPSLLHHTQLISPGPAPPSCRGRGARRPMVVGTWGGVDVWDEAVAVRPGLGGSYGSPLPPGRLRPSRGGQLRPTGDAARPTPIPWQVGSLRVALRAYTTNPIVRNPSPGTEESPQKKRDQNRDRF